VKALRLVLRLNALSCLGFGLIFTFAGAPVAAFLGEFPVAAVRTIGVLLAVNGAHLVYASLRPRLLPLEIFYFSAGDIAWFIATLALLAGGFGLTTPAGQTAALLVALGVLALGLAQVWLWAEATGSGRSGNASPDRRNDLIPDRYSRLTAIGVSWMGLKLWVKLWLFAINGIFLAALAFWPEPVAKFTLAAYVASGPLLFAFMAMQRGLTGLLGLAHLIPWLPLMAYLVARLAGLAAGPRITPGDAPALFAYVLTLLAMVGACLLFDVYDVVRWFRGEQYRIGASEPAAAGPKGASAISA